MPPLRGGLPPQLSGVLEAVGAHTRALAEMEARMGFQVWSEDLCVDVVRVVCAMCAQQQPSCMIACVFVHGRL